MRILLVGDYARDARLGSTKLQEEFRALGHVCDLLLADDLGIHPRNAQLRQAVAPILAVAAIRRAFQANGAYDVVDVASAEGLWIGAANRARVLGHTVVVARSNGLEHLDYQRMIDDHNHGLLHKPWSRRIVYPVVRLSQVAAAARVADRLILLNETDRDFALAHHWKGGDKIDVVPHGISSTFLSDAPARNAPRGRGILFCGSWAAVKGVNYLAAAFSTIVASGVRTNLTVLGGAVADELGGGAVAGPVRAAEEAAGEAAELDAILLPRRRGVRCPGSIGGAGLRPVPASIMAAIEIVSIAKAEVPIPDRLRPDFAIAIF